MGEKNSSEPFAKGIFSSQWHALLAASLYTILLYATVDVAFYAYIAVFRRIGEGNVSWALNSVYGLGGAAVLAFLYLRLPRSWSAYCTLAVIGAILIYTLRLLEVPANRIHFLLYAPLTVLWLDVVRFKLRNWRLYPSVFLIVLLIGCGDEMLQALQPERRFDPQDVLLNGMAAVLTLVFVRLVVGEENYPYGRPSNRRWH